MEFDLNWIEFQSDLKLIYPKNHGISSHYWQLEIPEPNPAIYPDPNPSTWMFQEVRING